MQLIHKSIELQFQEGSSDKIYLIQLVQPSNDQLDFVVNFQFGRRGSTLSTGTKTASPISFDKAEQIFNKLAGEKIKKGYEVSREFNARNNAFNSQADGKPSLIQIASKEKSGFHPQLLNPISEDDLENIIDHPRWVAEEKMDGENRSVRKIGDQFVGINKLGNVVPLTESITSALSKAEDFLINGEQIGDYLYVFDILEISVNGVSKDLRNHSYEDRMAVRDRFIDAIDSDFILSVDSAIQNKREFLEEKRVGNREGVVFKNLDSTFTPGKSHNDQVKFKFYDECSVIVGAHNEGKRSVQMEVLDETGSPISVGSVTIPPNKDIPDVGSIIEVTYLYAYEGGSLFQPVFNKLRNDVLAEECTTEQLKFKLEHQPKPKM